MKTQKWSLIFLIVAISGTALFAQSEMMPRVYRSNSKYQTGDWVGYTATRWVRTIEVGTEYVYAATSGGIIRYNYYSKRFEAPWTRANGLADNDVYVVAFDEATYNVWCATAVSISCYFPTFQWWENYYYDEHGMPVQEQVVSIGFDEQFVWILFSDGKYFQGNKQGGGFFRQVSQQDVQEASVQWHGIQEGRKTELPQIFMSEGYMYDPDGYIQDLRLNRYRISTWIFDKWGKYWVGTQGLGLGVAEVRIDQLEMMNPGPWIQDVKALALDRQNDVMWIGGIESFIGETGMTAWNRSENKWIHYQAKYISELINDKVNRIAIDGDFVWFSTEFGLARYDTHKDSWKTFDVFSHLTDEFIFDVAVDDSNVWVGTRNGVTRISKYSLAKDSLLVEHISRSALLDVPVYDLDIMGNLVWMGTEYGVYVYDKRKKIGGFQAAAGGPTSEPVQAVCVYGNQAWFGTSHGVEVYDVNKKKWLGVPFRLIEAVDNVNFITADDDAVWVGTERGVYKFDRRGERWVHFTVEDGLLHNRVTSIVLDGDYVWFGGPEGLTRFYWNAPYRTD